MNLERFKENVRSYESRVELREAAIGLRNEIVNFGHEDSGRYGGIGLRHSSTIRVQCLAINDILEEVLTQRGSIDILKIDVEGLEAPIVSAIEPRFFEHIETIYAEAVIDPAVVTNIHELHKYGDVARFRHVPAPRRPERAPIALLCIAPAAQPCGESPDGFRSECQRDA